MKERELDTRGLGGEPLDDKSEKAAGEGYWVPHLMDSGEFLEDRDWWMLGVKSGGRRNSLKTS